MKKIVPAFIILFIFFTQCVRDKKKNEKVKFYLDNGKTAIIESDIYSTDTIFNGLGVYYLANGQKEDEVKFKNGAKSGISIHFDSTGTPVSKSTYLHDKLNGPVIYFRSGTSSIDTEQWYYNDYLLSIKFYDDSNRINQYIGMSDKAVFYSIKYSKGENITEEGGAAFGNVIELSRPFDSIKVNENFTMKIPVVNAKKRKVALSAITSLQKDIDQGKPINIPIDNYYGSYNYNFTQSGNYAIKIFGDLKDETGKLLKRYEETFNIKVIE